MSHFLLRHMTYCAGFGDNRIFFDFVGRVVITESGIFFDYWAGSKKRNRIFSLIIGWVRDRIADKSGLLFLFL